MLSELSEYFTDMFIMLLGVIREDQNVIEINNNSNVKKILEDVIHETLGSGRCISQTKGHDMPFKRAIASTESGLPFVTFSYVDQVISMSEVKGSVDTMMSMPDFYPWKLH